jgi:hypothetical protein
MTNLQLFIAVGLAVLAVITSLIISLVQISGIREDMRFQNASIREDIRELRSDMKLLTGKVYELMGQK